MGCPVAVLELADVLDQLDAVDDAD